MFFQKIEKITFYSLLVLLPINLAKHFPTPYSYSGGMLVDYLLPTIYLTDLLILTLIILVRKNKKTPKLIPTTMLLLVPLIFSTALASNQSASIYKTLKFAEFIFFAWYTSTHINIKKDWGKIIAFVSINICAVSTLAILQYTKQSSVFGYWFFGEPVFNSAMVGIAKTAVLGQLKVRPYSTFPHPNVLGGYLAIMLVWLAHYLKQWPNGSACRSFNKNKYNVLTKVAFVLGYIGLILTFSRTAWVAFSLGITILFWKKLKKFAVPGIVIVGFSILNQLESFTDTASWIRRLELAKVAKEMFLSSPLFGIGINNFTVRLREFGTLSGIVWFLQPVHNVPLLIAAELGLVGLTVFGIFFAKLLQKAKQKPLLLISLLQIILISQLDHYFWTLQQTALLLWLVVGLVWC